MRCLFVTLIGAIALAACGEREAATVETQAPAAPVTAPVVAQAAQASLVSADLGRVCRAGLAAIYGQQPVDITVEALEAGVVQASWRAPVDGGRMRAQCRVEQDRIVWKPLDLPDPTLVRWMNQSGDPVIRFAMNGETITINQTLPDGTTEQAELAVPAEKEAR